MADINLLPEEYKKKSEDDEKKIPTKKEIQYTNPSGEKNTPTDKKQNWREFLDSVLPKKKEKPPQGVHPLKKYPDTRSKEKKPTQPVNDTRAKQTTGKPMSTDGVMPRIQAQRAPSLWQRIAGKEERKTNADSMPAKTVKIPPAVPQRRMAPPPPPPPTPLRPMAMGNTSQPMGGGFGNVQPKLNPLPKTTATLPEKKISPDGIQNPLPKSATLPISSVGKGQIKKNTETIPTQGRDFLRYKKKPFGLDVNLVPTEVLLTAKPKNLLTTFSWLNVGAVAFLLLGYVGLMLYGLRLQNSTTSLNNQIQKVNAEIATYGPVQKEAKTLKAKIDATEALLGEHIYWTKVLKKIQESTIDQVTFEAISADTNGNFQITARATNFSAIADQTRVFQNADFVEKVNVTGGAKEIGDETEKQPVQFTITMKIKGASFFHSTSL